MFEVNYKECAVKAAKKLGLDQNPLVKSDRYSPFYGNIEKFAIERLAFIECYKCKKLLCLGPKETYR